MIAAARTVLSFAKAANCLGNYLDSSVRTGPAGGGGGRAEDRARTGIWANSIRVALLYSAMGAVTDSDRGTVVASLFVSHALSLEFADELIRGYNAGSGIWGASGSEDVLWMSWVEGCIGKAAKKLHRRLLVVCKYRLLVVKKGGLFSKNSLERELPWFDLIEIREQARVRFSSPESHAAVPYPPFVLYFE